MVMAKHSKIIEYKIISNFKNGEFENYTVEKRDITDYLDVWMLRVIYKSTSLKRCKNFLSKL